MLGVLRSNSCSATVDGLPSSTDASFSISNETRNTAPSSLGMASGEGGLQAMSAVVAGSRDSCCSHDR